MTPADKALVGSARTAGGVADNEGPDDDHLLAGIRGFVSAFDFWYIRVVRGAVPKYRPLIIARINTFIRSWELEGLNAQQAAARLVEDYARRNFVTAGVLGGSWHEPPAGAQLIRHSGMPERRMAEWQTLRLRGGTCELP